MAVWRVPVVLWGWVCCEERKRAIGRVAVGGVVFKGSRSNSCVVVAGCIQ